MAVINFYEYKNRPTMKMKAENHHANHPTEFSGDLVGLSSHNDLDSVASKKVENQIKADLSFLTREFFDVIPTTDKNAVIRLYSEYDTGRVMIEGDIIHHGFYKALFNYDDAYMNTFNWLKVNITMMAHAKELSDFTLQYPSRRDTAAAKYSHLTMADKGMSFVLEFRNGELTAFAESPIKRYFKRAI